ncbi:hypothetical protein BJV74DRAFT_869967 [Russula compacta]|nr:hypothetical protein BJV74DRAFT_869967 [Russula compacta]
MYESISERRQHYRHRRHCGRSDRGTVCPSTTSNSTVESGVCRLRTSIRGRRTSPSPDQRGT